MSSKIEVPVMWEYRGGYYSWKLLDANGKETGITATREIKELATALNRDDLFDKLVGVLKAAAEIIEHFDSWQGRASEKTKQECLHKVAALLTKIKELEDGK